MEAFLNKMNITSNELSNLLNKSIKIIIIIIIMYLSIKLGIKLINRFVKKQENMRFSLDTKKAKTLGEVLKSILRYSVYIFGIISIVEIIFGTLGIAFASIGGVALGFGTQSLVKDIINGFFILFEDQFAVGDHINVDDKGGIVESMELRVTRIRDFNGDLHIIPNGLVTKVTNHSRGNIKVVVEVDVPHEVDIDEVTDLINKVCIKFARMQENMVECPYGSWSFSLEREQHDYKRYQERQKPLTQWDCEMNLRKDIKNALKEANIEVPYAKRRIISEDNK